MSDGMFKKTDWSAKAEPTVIQVGNVKIGGGNLTTLAGPCTIESESQLMTIAQRVVSAGADVFRAGAYKPRTSPYSYQGMQEEGLKLLSRVKREYNIPVISEVTEVCLLSLFDDIDILQIGAKNMQNFEILKAVGKLDKPVMLKRGAGATYEELLSSAEYIMNEGNEQVILCERGIRTFERETRNTLDLSAVPYLKLHTHLPVIVDPSHATGRADLIPALSCAAVAAGADGVMLEVHNDPCHSKCDANQAITPDEFASILTKMHKIKSAL